jgi:hypothetical protein
VTSRYAGRLHDAFAKGCVTYEFDFAPGPHIALIDELQTPMCLYLRRQRRQELPNCPLGRSTVPTRSVLPPHG